MKILAIETATIAGSVAIVDDIEGVTGDVRVNVRAAHAERLMPAVQWLLQASSLSVSDMDAFAVSIGPGSFTGLRIGLSTAKGFAYASGKPLVPVPTLDAFAMTLPFSRHIVCPLLDARKNEVFAALYKWDGKAMVKVMNETALSPDELAGRIDAPVVFLGEGAMIYRELLQDRLGDRACFAPPDRMSPSASTVACAGLEQIRGGTVCDPERLIPFYIRRSEAEVRWKG